MTDTASPDPPILARLTVRTGHPWMLSERLGPWFSRRRDPLGVYVVRASSAELDALVREIQSHDYWAKADPLADNHKTATEILGLVTPASSAVEVSPDDVRRELYWLFED